MSFRTLRNIIVLHDEKTSEGELKDLIRRTRDVFSLGSPPETYTGKEKLNILHTGQTAVKEVVSKIKKKLKK